MARPNYQFGMGGLVPAGPNPYARWMFLSSASAHVPDALRALADLAREGVVAGQPAYAEWARRWHMSSDAWLSTVAAETLQRWHDYPHLLAEPLKWHKSPISWYEPDYRPDPPLLWNPRSEPESAFRERVSAYVAAVRKAEAESGWLESPTKRNLEHFDWLALYHIGGWTQAAISERYQDESGTPNPSGVSRALADTAALIGLTLRNDASVT